MTLPRSKGLILIGVICSALLLASSARAENIIVTQPTDFWFEYTEPTQFIAETFMVQGVNSDPQLWLYDEQNVLLTTNDDYLSLQSFISVNLNAGRYRLRAGVCCYQPDVWRSGNGWNEQYQLVINGEPIATTTTTTVEPTTTTTTVAPTTTTTTTVVPTTVQETTTTSVLLPTTTLPQTTTTVSPHIDTVPSTTTTSTPEQTTTTIELQTTTSSSSIAPSSSSTTITTTTTIVNDSTTTTTVPAVPTAESLMTASVAEAEQVFESLDLSTLDDTQLTALVEAVQDAPFEIREAFEDKVDIFSGEVDSYVPIGSTIPVSQRRALIAITAVTVAGAALSKRRW